MSQRFSVKAKIVPDNETRRFALDVPTFESLRTILMKILKINDIEQFNTQITIKYEDDEKDLITVETEEEFTEAVFLTNKKESPVLILVIQKKEPQTQQQPQNAHRGWGWGSGGRGCGGGSRGWGCGNGWQSRKTWWHLHREALKLLESTVPADLEKALQLFLQQFSLTPSNPITLYNLACTESRLGKIDQALKYLKDAIQNGYSDVEHMKKDTDLESLRNNEEFKNIVSELEKNPPKTSERDPCSFRRRCWERKKNWFMKEKKIQALFKSGSVQDLEEARTLILEQISSHESAHSVYNLSCVESLLKNEKPALDYLQRAIDLGWKDLEHIDRDSDLDFIRNTPQFKEIIEKLKDKILKKDDLYPKPEVQIKKPEEDQVKKTEDVQNKPEEVPKKENVQVPDYTNLLSMLADMGFVNVQENMRILRQTNGDLLTTVTILSTQ
jgi:tetratricopeptide (TPR) repeat protein